MCCGDLSLPLFALKLPSSILNVPSFWQLASLTTPQREEKAKQRRRSQAWDLHPNARPKPHAIISPRRQALREPLAVPHSWAVLEDWMLAIHSAFCLASRCLKVLSFTLILSARRGILLFHLLLTPWAALRVFFKSCYPSPLYFPRLEKEKSLLLLFPSSASSVLLPCQAPPLTFLSSSLWLFQRAAVYNWHGSCLFH